MTEAQRRRIRREDITANHPARPIRHQATESDPTPVSAPRPRLHLVK
jgi:hypothetical protein